MQFESEDSLLAEFPPSGKVSLFAKAFNDWMRLTHIMEYSLLSSSLLMLILVSPKTHLHIPSARLTSLHTLSCIPSYPHTHILNTHRPLTHPQYLPTPTHSFLLHTAAYLHNFHTPSHPHKLPTTTVLTFPTPTLSYTPKHSHTSLNTNTLPHCLSLF